MRESVDFNDLLLALNLVDSATYPFRSFTLYADEVSSERGALKAM